MDDDGDESRSSDRTESDPINDRLMMRQTLNELEKKYSSDKVKGITCDICQSVDLEALLAFAVDSLQGPVDVLINNAGESSVGENGGGRRGEREKKNQKPFLPPLTQ